MAASAVPGSMAGSFPLSVGTALGKESSVGSTRASSPARSSASTSDDASASVKLGGFEQHLEKHDRPRRHSKQTIAQRRGVSSGLCVEVADENSATTTAAEDSQRLSSAYVGGHMLSTACTSPAHIITGTNPLGGAFQSAPSTSPAHIITGTRPPLAGSQTPVGDASQRRSPTMTPGRVFFKSPKMVDASRRSPMQMDQSLVKAMRGADASQRSPVSFPGETTSWGAAAASVAATRSAAVLGTTPVGGESPLKSRGVCPVPVSMVALATQPPPNMCPRTPSASASPTKAMNSLSPDSLKCWLSGLTWGNDGAANAVPSTNYLAEQLLAALPETYED